MVNEIIAKCRLNQTKYSFGATSAIITNLGIITGLDTLAHPKISIIGGILVIAIADNISDSLGIHIYQESECVGTKEVWISTLTNFFTRAFVSSVFIALVALLPIKSAVYYSIAWGLAILAFISYTIAKARGTNPFRAIFEHIVLAVVVIIASNFIGKLVIGNLIPK